MARTKQLDTGDNQYNINLFDLTDNIDVDLINANSENLADAIEEVIDISNDAKTQSAEAEATANSANTNYVSLLGTVSGNTSSISALNSFKDKVASVMTVRNSNTYNVTATDTPTKIYCGYLQGKSGTLLTQSNGGIKIGAGITKVLVCGQVYYADKLTAGHLMYGAVYDGTTLKQGAYNRVATVSASLDVDTKVVDKVSVVTGVTLKRTATSCGVPIVPTLISVSPNDVIYLYGGNFSGKSGLCNADYHTRLTVIAIG